MERRESRSGPAGHIETLDREACLVLLPTVVIGRVAWAASSDDLRVVPVNFVLDGDSIVFRTTRGGKLDAVQHGVTLTFEVDDVEPALRVGWSVVLSGRAEVVTDRGQIRHLEQLAGAPWPAMTEPVFVRLSCTRSAAGAFPCTRAASSWSTSRRPDPGSRPGVGPPEESPGLRLTTQRPLPTDVMARVGIESRPGPRQGLRPRAAVAPSRRVVERQAAPRAVTSTRMRVTTASRPWSTTTGAGMALSATADAVVARAR